MTGPARDPAAGFTLIEMLIVLAVIGIAAGATMLGFGNRGGSAEAEAVRLARHLTLGVDEALIGGRPLVLQWDAQGYRFGQRPAGQAGGDPADWPAVDLPVLALRHDLAQPLHLGLRDVATPVAVILPASGTAPIAVFDITGTQPAWTVTFDGYAARAQPEGGT